MMKLVDLVCNNCAHVFEELVSPGEVTECPLCKSMDTYTVLVNAPNLNTMNLLSPKEYKAKMLQRSADHTKKEVKKEPEKFFNKKAKMIG